MDTLTERLMENPEVCNKHAGTFKLMGQGMPRSTLYDKLLANKPDKISRNILIGSHMKNTASSTYSVV